MTAAECLKSDDPKAVGRFYAELRTHDQNGELAFQLLRAHRDVSRLRHYDDPKYMKFIEGRAEWAIGQLADFLEVDGDKETLHRVTALVPPEVTFKRNSEGEWKTTKKNERIIVIFCDRITEGKI